MRWMCLDMSRSTHCLNMNISPWKSWTPIRLLKIALLATKLHNLQSATNSNYCRITRSPEPQTKKNADKTKGGIMEQRNQLQCASRWNDCVSSSNSTSIVHKITKKWGVRNWRKQGSSHGLTHLPNSQTNVTTVHQKNNSFSGSNTKCSRAQATSLALSPSHQTAFCVNLTHLKI